MNDCLAWLKLLIPETLVVVTALLILTVDLAILRRKATSLRVATAGVLAVLGCAAAIGFACCPVTQQVGMLTINPLTQLAKQAILGLTIFTVLVSFSAKFTKHVGEYFTLLLFAAVGLLFLVSSDNLLMIFVALELLSVSLYAMVAFNKASGDSAEAALKYFLFGSMAAAFTVYGISLIYGLTGSLDLPDIAKKLGSQTATPALYLALVMTLIGFAFKLAAAPFHLWAPDVYQGAPTPVAAFIASGSKVGSFFVLARILITGFGQNSGSAVLSSITAGWMPVLAVIAVASMVLGNIAAILQSNVKRLLAYSAIAHGGYALLAFFGTGPKAMSALMFYVITYAATVLGAFAVVSLVENSTGSGNMRDFAGLSRRAPVLSACMAVFMLSLAGIPPLAGFFGKLYVFTAVAAGANNLGLIWLVIVAISASAISLYYYLQVLKQIYVADPPEQPAPLEVNAVATIAIVVLAAVVVFLGCLPDFALNKLSSAMASTIF